MILEELKASRFSGDDLFGFVERYLNNQGLQALTVYALDARVLYMLSKQNKYIYAPYMSVCKILTDGRPIYWLVGSLIEKPYKQVTGPQFMQGILDDVRFKHKRHMFYGGNPSTVERLRLKCKKNSVNVVYAESPPFLTIDELEIDKVNALIKDLEIDFFWCGLGAPKQEYLIYRLNKSTRTVMSGVGLAFDYYAGTVRNAPEFLSILGLEWMYRYWQQPRRIGRFLFPFLFVLKLLIINKLKTNRLISN